MNNTLSLIQSEIHSPKSKRAQNFEYRSYEDILETAKPILAKHDATIIATDEVQDISGHLFVKATLTLHVYSDKEFDTYTSTGYAQIPDKLAAMSAPQITGSCSSYARKYAICGLLAIDNNKEIDQATDEHNSGVCNDKASVINAIKNCKSRDEFNALQKRFSTFLADKDVIDVCVEISKKFPKTTNKA